jgi:hypothetical protein
MSDLVVKNKTAQYLLINAEIKELKKQQERLKDELEPALLGAETNARGSHVIKFAEPLVIDGVRYASLQKVRKESKVLNEERAIAWLDERARDASPDRIPFKDSDWYSPIVTVQHIDQDALWNLFVQDKISQEELDSFFDITESFAFMTTRE